MIRTLSFPDTSSSKAVKQQARSPLLFEEPN